MQEFVVKLGCKTVGRIRREVGMNTSSNLPKDEMDQLMCEAALFSQIEAADIFISREALRLRFRK